MTVDLTDNVDRILPVEFPTDDILANDLQFYNIVARKPEWKKKLEET